MLRSLPALTVGLLAVSLSAQTQAQLVGVTRIAGNLRKESSTVCQTVGLCVPIGFPAAAGLPLNAGGTAWDPIHAGAWITNGNVVACVDDTCNYLCPPFAPVLPPNSVIAGLEVVPEVRQLWAIDTADMLHVLDLTSCPPTPIVTCNVAFPNAFATGGLAVDNLADIVFYARWDAATQTQYIAMASRLAPCVILNGLAVLPCQGAPAPFTGLAVDAVARMLFATTGDRTFGIPYTPMPGLGAVLGVVTCCAPPAAAGDPMIGLAIRPGHGGTVGTNCASGTCPACPMLHDTVGDSVLGNLDFALRLAGAPVGSFAWCMVGDGPCVAPGVVVPPLCGAAHTLPLLGILGANAVPGAGVCNGSTDFPLAIPANAALGGLVLSSQCFSMCLAGPGGFAMSACTSFRLQGM